MSDADSDSPGVGPESIGKKDRVLIDRAASLRLSAWSEDLKEKMWGRVLSRSELASFLILSHPASLTEKEVIELQRLHHDPTAALMWAAEKAKQARENGEKIDVASLCRRMLEQTRDRGGR